MKNAVKKVNDIEKNIEYTINCLGFANSFLF